MSRERQVNLTTYHKSGYGAAEVGITSVQILTQLYLLEFYTQSVGLKPSLAGIALAISVVWDAISDPLMGFLSDNTQSRWGKRRPYILLGSLFLSVCVVFLFSPPQNSYEQSSLFLYLLSCYVAVNTAMTILSVPHLALGGELSDIPEERTELFGWRLLFSNVGILIGMLLPAILLEYFYENETPGALYKARQITSILIGVAVVVSGSITFFVTGSRQIEKKPHLVRKDLSWFKKIPLDFQQALRNPVFLPLFLAFVVATFGRTFNTSIALFYYKFFLGLEETQIVVGILLPFFVIIIASIPFWVKLSNRYGKKFPAFWGIFVLGIMTVIAYPLYPYGNPYYPLITAGLGGICAGSIFLLDSLVADIVDYDELLTGETKEGLYFGIWKMGTKLAQAVGLALSGNILEWIGFIPGESIQPDGVPLRLALVFGPLVGVFFLSGAFLFLTFPLDKNKYERIRNLLEKKREKHKRLLDIPK